MNGEEGIGVGKRGRRGRGGDRDRVEEEGGGRINGGKK